MHQVVPEAALKILNVSKKKMTFPFGFTLNLKNSLWKPLSLTQTSTPFILYDPLSSRSPSPHSSSSQSPYNEAPPFDVYLTVRTSVLEKKSIKMIKKEWEKDFLHAGFDILKSKSFKISKDKKGFLFYLKFKFLRVHQVIFLKNIKAVYLTCYAPLSKFDKALKSCNHIARNFHWLKS